MWGRVGAESKHSPWIGKRQVDTLLGWQGSVMGILGKGESSHLPGSEAPSLGLSCPYPGGTAPRSLKADIPERSSAFLWLPDPVASGSLIRAL